MVRLTFTRDEWASIARDLGDTDGDAVPPGLAARIEALLRDTPAGWAVQPCALELDPAGADAVADLVDRRGGRSGRPDDESRRAGALADAAGIVRDHQQDRPTATFRVEHRSGGRTTVIAHTSRADARQAELSHHAARLIAAGATGELVLVDEATGAEVARRALRPEGAEPAGEGTR